MKKWTIGLLWLYCDPCKITPFSCAFFIPQHFFLFVFPLLGWILDAARLLCQDAAEEVVASSFCKVGGVSLYAGSTTFMVRKWFFLLCCFLVAVAFKGVNTLSSRKLKLNVNRDWRKEARRIPYKIPMHLISGKTKKSTIQLPVAK